MFLLRWKLKSTIIPHKSKPSKASLLVSCLDCCLSQFYNLSTNQSRHRFVKFFFSWPNLLYYFFYISYSFFIVMKPNTSYLLRTQGINITPIVSNLLAL